VVATVGWAAVVWAALVAAVVTGGLVAEGVLVSVSAPQAANNRLIIIKKIAKKALTFIRFLPISFSFWLVHYIGINDKAKSYGVKKKLLFVQKVNSYSRSKKWKSSPIDYLSLEEAWEVDAKYFEDL
jgi:hypothetical protein